MSLNHSAVPTQAGDKFEMTDGSIITVVGVRNVARYVTGETQTRAGREPVRIRMDDATVYDCEMDGVRYTNSAADMNRVASSFPRVHGGES